MEELCVVLEKLCEQSLECMIIDAWIRVEKVKVDIDQALLDLDHKKHDNHGANIQLQNQNRQSRPVCVFPLVER